MKKTILIFALILAFVLGAYAQGSPAEPAAMEPSLAEGVVLEILEDGYLIESPEMGEIKLVYSEETVFETTHAIAAGDYIYADYNGQTTFSLPPQISASRICMYRAIGSIVEILPEDNAVLLSTDAWGEVRATLPAEWAGQEINAEQLIVYFNGAMTMSLPPQINADHVLPAYALQGAVTQIDETSLLIGEGMEATQVNFDPAQLPESLNVGDVIRVIHSGMMTRSLPAQVSAIEIIQVSR